MKLNIIRFISLLTILAACKGRSNTVSLNSDQFNKVLITGDTVKELSNNIMVIYHDKNNNYWYGSWEDGLYKYNGKSILHYTTQHNLADNRIEEIKEDNHGDIFINTRSGLCKFEGDQIVLVKEAFPALEKWELESDDLWFKSTKPGYVSRYDGRVLLNLEVPNSKIGEEYRAKNPGAIDPYGIYCIYKDSKGNIWFGTSLLGALRYNGKSFDWISEPDVTEMHNGPANGVRSIIEDKDGFFWFNSEYRYLVLDNAEHSNDLFYKRYKSIGNLDGKEDSQLNEYLSIARDNNNNLWIATYRNGVWKYDGNHVSHYSVQENGKDIHLFYIYKDREGNIWLGTHENGIWKLIGDQFIRFKP